MVYFLIILWYISSSPPLQCATTFCFHSAGWVEASPAWQQGAITHRAADPTEPRHFQAPELHNTTSLRQQMGAKIPCPTTSPTSRQCSPPPPYTLCSLLAALCLLLPMQLLGSSASSAARCFGCKECHSSWLVWDQSTLSGSRASLKALVKDREAPLSALSSRLSIPGCVMTLPT